MKYYHYYYYHMKHYQTCSCNTQYIRILGNPGAWKIFNPNKETNSEGNGYIFNWG